MSDTPEDRRRRDELRDELRDQFAQAALAGLAANPAFTGTAGSSMAHAAWELAIHMLKERDGRGFRS